MGGISKLRAWKDDMESKGPLANMKNTKFPLLTGPSLGNLTSTPVLSATVELATTPLSAHSAMGPQEDVSSTLLEMEASFCYLGDMLCSSGLVTVALLPDAVWPGKSSKKLITTPARQRPIESHFSTLPGSAYPVKLGSKSTLFSKWIKQFDDLSQYWQPWQGHLDRSLALPCCTPAQCLISKSHGRSHWVICLCWFLNQYNDCKKQWSVWMRKQYPYSYGWKWVHSLLVTKCCHSRVLECNFSMQ